MTKGGRVRHWKHGWIPLDQAAYEHRFNGGPKPGPSTPSKPMTKAQKVRAVNLLRKQRGQDPLPEKAPAKRSGAVTFTAVDPDQELLKKDYVDMTPAEKIRASEIMFGKNSSEAKLARGIYAPDAPSARERAASYRHIDTVDGVDFVTYKSSAFDPLGDDHGNPHQFTHEQEQILADGYNEVAAQFPSMKPVQIVGVDGKNGAFGITSWDGRRISISSDLFDPAKLAYAKEHWQNHGAIAGGFVDDPEAFARAVMTHELGHALQMQNSNAKRRGDMLATEGVTPEEMGVDTSGWVPGEHKTEAQRWQVDTLNMQSVYATGNQYEWFAEAFADAWFNGDKAQPQSKRALAILHDVYGTGTAA